MQNTPTPTHLAQATSLVAPPPTVSVRRTSKLESISSVLASITSASSLNSNYNQPTQCRELLALYPTPNDLCQAYGPMLQMKLMASMPSKGELAELDTVPSLGLVSSTYGHSTSVFWMGLQISSLLDYVEQKSAIDEQSLIECATLFVARYSYLNLLEIILFFAEVKVGTYGDFFGSIGPMQLSIMFNKYIEQRNYDIDIYLRAQTLPRIENNRKLYRTYMLSYDPTTT